MENSFNLCSEHIRVQSVDESGNIDATVIHNGNNYDHVFIYREEFNNIMSGICIRGFMVAIPKWQLKKYNFYFSPSES